MNFFIVASAAAALGVAIAAVGCAYSLGNSTVSAMEATARQPEAAGDIRTTFIIGAAFIEALTIYALAIGIMLWLRLPGSEAVLDSLEALS